MLSGTDSPPTLFDLRINGQKVSTMTSWYYDSELAEQIELTVERYWINGMSLSDARKKTLGDIFGGNTEDALARSGLPSRFDSE